MGVNQRRRYNSPQRATQANATRQHVLSAASALFTRHGYAAVTIPAIAREAGVSVATVYLYFPGKAAIVEALADAVVAAPELSVEQVEQASDAVTQVRIGARILRTLNERSWLVADILRTARGSDPRLMAIWEVWQGRHLDAMRRAIAAVEARSGLRPGLTADEAVDSLYALASTDVYRALIRERDWSPERYERWLFRIGCVELLGVMPTEE